MGTFRSCLQTTASRKPLNGLQHSREEPIPGAVLTATLGGVAATRTKGLTPLQRAACTPHSFGGLHGLFPGTGEARDLAAEKQA